MLKKRATVNIVLALIVFSSFGGCTVTLRNFWRWMTGAQTVIMPARITPKRGEKIALVPFVNKSGLLDVYSICQNLPQMVASRMKEETALDVVFYNRLPGYDINRGLDDPVKVRKVSRARYLVYGSLETFSDNVEQNPLYKKAYVKAVVVIWDLENDIPVYDNEAARLYPTKRDPMRTELIETSGARYLNAALSLLADDIAKIFYEHEEYVDDLRYEF